MRTQTFAAFLLTAALPAIVAALPTNIPNTQLTSAPAFEARSTHAIEDISLAKRSEVVARQEGGQPGDFTDVADAIGLDDYDANGMEEGPEQAGHQFGGEEPQEFEGSFMGDDDDDDLDDFADVDFSQLRKQMLQRRDEDDSNYEGPLDDDEKKPNPEEPRVDIDILQARSDEEQLPDPEEVAEVVEPGIPTRFRRRHEGHDETHEAVFEGSAETAEMDEAHSGHEGYEPHDGEEADMIEDEDKAEMMERRQLNDIANDIAEDEDDDGEDDAFAGPDMSAHAGDDEDDDDDDEVSVEGDIYDEDVYEQDGFGLERRDDTEVAEGITVEIAKRQVYKHDQLPPQPIERRVARSFRA
ncbi:hypothetical protein PspLS_01776 [Pyricularia sp. CBS 133598]|nr:hypothetical protein PspLS_01776 [Pyricularia sp. CBS 133598]